VLHALAGDRVDAARLAGNTALHQLNASLALRFESAGSRTRLHVDRQEPPLKVVRAFTQPDGAALVHLHNVSGGVLAGDRLSLDIQVGPQAEAQVTSTGATRLYRHRAGAEDSVQRVTISVGENALLEYLPDPVIPFAGSRHEQHTSISLASGATVFWWEVLTPGRLAAGERFAYQRLRMSSSIRAAGRLVLREDFLLEPERRSPSQIARMGAYSYMASFYAVQEGRPAEDWRELENRLNQVTIGRSQDAVWGASTLVSDGVIVRGLSSTARGLAGALVEFWSVARRYLTGRDAILPRKVY
jgi:urease accessory protein